MSENDLINSYTVKWDGSNSGSVVSDNTDPSWDNKTWTTNYPYPGYPYDDEKTNVPYTNPYDKWHIPNWPYNPNDQLPIPNKPFDFPTIPTQPKIDQNLQNLINQLQIELAEQKKELEKITKKCDRLFKNNKKLKKENKELEKRNNKLNKFSRFDILDIEEDEN